MTPVDRPLRPAVAGRHRGTVPGPFQDYEAPAALAHLVGAHAINDGIGMIKLEVPHIVERGAATPVSIEVNWPMVLAKAVVRLYIVADSNLSPLLARITLLPDVVPPHVALEVRLDAATHVRAVVQCGDGTVLQVKRWVWVMPPRGEADPVHHTAEPSGGQPATTTRGDHP